MDVCEHVEAVTASFHRVTVPKSRSAPALSSTSLQDVEDLSDRFMTWSSNIRCLPGGLDGLKKRLAQAPELRDSVVELLKDLVDDLEEVYQIFSLDHSEAVDQKIDFVAYDTEANFTEEASNPGYPRNNTTLEMVTEDIDEAIACLMRLQAPLADERRVTSPRGSIDTQYSFDIKTAYPQAPVFVVDRLAKATSDRRAALLAAIQPVREAVDHASSSDGNSPQDEELRYAEEFRILSKALLTVEPILCTRQGSMPRDDHSPDDASISSTASGEDTFVGTTTCSLCSQSLAFSCNSDLRRHFYNDLKPYICLFQDCTFGSTRYGTRSAWIEHIRHVHGQVWRCCFGCIEVFGSREGFEKHMHLEHSPHFRLEELTGLANMCEKHVLTDDATRCPICKEFTGNIRSRYRHIARHLENLALLSMRPPGEATRGPEPSENAVISNTRGLSHPDSYSDYKGSYFSGEDTVSTIATSRGEEGPEIHAMAPELETHMNIHKRNTDLLHNSARLALLTPAHPSELSPPIQTSLEETTRDRATDQWSDVAAEAPPEPSCAICGRHDVIDCPHEGERLELALQQAQDRWAGVLRIREWVINHARNHVLNTFEAARAARYATYLQYVKTFPYYSLYTYHNGRPPLPPAQLQFLREQIWSADENLRLGVDTDWRNTCLLYPETLDHYFGLVECVFPEEKNGLVPRPEIKKRRIRNSVVNM